MNDELKNIISKLIFIVSYGRGADGGIKRTSTRIEINHGDTGCKITLVDQVDDTKYRIGMVLNGLIEEKDLNEAMVLFGQENRDIAMECIKLLGFIFRNHMAIEISKEVVKALRHKVEFECADLNKCNLQKYN